MLLGELLDNRALVYGDVQLRVVLHLLVHALAEVGEVVVHEALVEAAEDAGLDYEVAGLVEGGEDFFAGILSGFGVGLWWGPEGWPG